MAAPADKQKQKKMRKRTSITVRWVRGSLFFTIAVVLVAEAVFLYYMISGYYNYAQAAINDQMNGIFSQLKLFSSSTYSAEDKALRLLRSVEQFEDKARFELMLIDAAGNVVISSSGMPTRQDEAAPDITAALRTGGAGRGYYVGENAGGEKVMAVTELTPYSSGGIVAMRMVTSLTLVDRTVTNLVFISILLILVIILASVISGIYFIRSIVLPLQNVEGAAASIAEGNFDNLIEIQSADEIGSLCTTINHMAGELSRAEQMKNDFISSVSHELRTPLTSIKGWIETVGKFSSPDDPGFRRGIEIIAGETDRLYEMVEELLDFSRLQNGLELKCQLLDLAAEVEEAVLLSSSRAGGLGISIAYTAPELPVPVMADPHRIRQVLLNVIDNAIKYSFSGGVISLELLQEAQSAFVTVKDEGRGISPEDLENVKIKFYKGQGAVRGSGIGLAVADEIMQAHGGALEINSELHFGTEVILRFPIHTKPALPAGQPAADGEAQAPGAKPKADKFSKEKK